MVSTIINHCSIIVILLCIYHIKIINGTPVASPNWELLITPDGVIFSPRNGVLITTYIIHIIYV